MCSIYSLFKLDEFIAAFFGSLNEQLKQAKVTPRYRIARSDTSTVIRRIDGKISIDQMKWGFDHPTMGKLVPHARAETISTGMFGSSFRDRRCLVPANGFYEYLNKTQPYYFQLKSKSTFCFAGVWKDDRFAVVTVGPNEIVKPIHDRMPVMLTEPQQWKRWLDEPDQGLLQPLQTDLMEKYPVERFGARIDNVSLIEPIKHLFS